MPFNTYVQEVDVAQLSGGQAPVLLAQDDCVIGEAHSLIAQATVVEQEPDGHQQHDQCRGGGLVQGLRQHGDVAEVMGQGAAATRRAAEQKWGLDTSTHHRRAPQRNDREVSAGAR